MLQEELAVLSGEGVLYPVFVKMMIAVMAHLETVTTIQFYLVIA